MAIPHDMTVIRVIVPKTLVVQLSALERPGYRSLSAVCRRILEDAIEHPLFLPARSVDTPVEAHTDRPTT